MTLLSVEVITYLKRAQLGFIIPAMIRDRKPKGGVGFQLPGQQSTIVTVAENIVDHGPDVPRLRVTIGKRSGAERFGVDDLKVEVGSSFFTRRHPSRSRRPKGED